MYIYKIIVQMMATHVVLLLLFKTFFFKCQKKLHFTENLQK